MNSVFKKIYIKSPIWIQNLIISIYGYKLIKQRYGTIYKKAFNDFKNRTYSSYNEEIKCQDIELQLFLNRTISNSKFYSKLYENIDISKIKSVEDLKLLPILDKESFRDNIENIYTLSENNAITSFTGGTTGKSLKVLFDKADLQKRMAYLDAFKYKCGINKPLKVKKATFSGRDLSIKNNSKIFWRNNYIYNQRIYSTFDINEKNIPYYISNLNKFKPKVINGFVSSIYEISEYIIRNKIELNFLPIAIFTTSETLLSFHRQMIEKAFKTPVFNQYASAEGAPFITECTHKNLHYNLDTGVIETLNTSIGNQMIITSFTSTGTPLIRYNIEDCITFKDGNCECGSTHPLVEKIEGRNVDYLTSIEKGKVSLSHLADIIKGIPNSVKKMQFIQEYKDHIVVLIVIDLKSFKEDHLLEIKKELENRFGVSMIIEISVVEDIPREKSGKYLLIKNNSAIQNTQI
jgi:phenylacetate-CoA ligase